MAAPADGGTMKKSNTHPNEIYPRQYVYIMPLPDSRKPRTKSFHLGSFKADYIITPRKFDRFGRCTHESRRLEITTKNGALLLSRWE